MCLLPYFERETIFAAGAHPSSLSHILYEDMIGSSLPMPVP